MDLEAVAIIASRKEFVKGKLYWNFSWEDYMDSRK
jgi:hypothetical protein